MGKPLPEFETPPNIENDVRLSDEEILGHLKNADPDSAAICKKLLNELLFDIHEILVERYPHDKFGSGGYASGARVTRGLIELYNSKFKLFTSISEQLTISKEQNLSNDDTNIQPT